MKRWPLYILLFLIFLIFPNEAYALEDNQFITVVNPVRISSYSKNPLDSLRAEYVEIANKNLPATWLLTYDVLENEAMISFLKNMDTKQEMGVFLEVSPKLAKDSGVEYNNTGDWHHAESVFLSGYTQKERKYLLDTLFEKFIFEFGYSPVSVGSWWTDSYSLAYLKERYQILANLVVSDQFSTDGYQIWGQYWSTPYYPSSGHAAVPATTESNKLNLVNIQWAPRDPINGYKNSLYSSQDFSLTSERLDTDYFEKLVRLYASKNDNSFGQVTVGLEADLNPQGYKGEYRKEMEIVQRLSEKEGYKVTNMKSFAEWYMKNFPDLSPPHLIKTKDLLGTNKEVTWYQSPVYRIGVLYDKDYNQTKIFDLRVFPEDTIEPYYLSPNREFTLSIYLASLLDETNNPEDVWTLNGQIQIDYKPAGFSIGAQNLSIPATLRLSPNVSVEENDGRTSVNISRSWYSQKDGVVIKDYSPEATHFFKQKKFIFYLLTRRGWEHFKKIDYIVPKGELDILFKLSTLPKGKVIVYDGECLQCSYHTKLKPAAFGNKRSYVKAYGKHPIVYNSSVFESESREEARKELSKLHASYFYLVKFEDYREVIPFSPGDLGVEKIYANANAEIWRITSSP